MPQEAQKSLNILDIISKMADELNSLRQKVAQLESDAAKDIPEDQRIERLLNKSAAKFLSLERGNDGYTPMKGVDYMDGYTPQKGVDYFDGYTPIKGKDYFDGTNGTSVTPEDVRPMLQEMVDTAEGDMMAQMPEMVQECEQKIEMNLPKFGEQFRDGLELLQGDERLDVSAIKGIDEKLQVMESKIPARVQTPAKAYKVIRIDLSSQLNGSKKTFGWGTHFGIVGVYSSSAPGVFRPTIDYTENTNGLTFTSAIDAATTLAAGQTLIVQYLR